MSLIHSGYVLPIFIAHISQILHAYVTTFTCHNHQIARNFTNDPICPMKMSLNMLVGKALPSEVTEQDKLTLEEQQVTNYSLYKHNTQFPELILSKLKASSTKILSATNSNEKPIHVTIESTEKVNYLNLVICN